MKANKRPGFIVCTCDRNGKIELYDPAAWRRAEYKRIRAIEKKEREDEKAYEESEAQGFFH